jgi:Sec-independent protein translocase protein TatA
MFGLGAPEILIILGIGFIVFVFGSEKTTDIAREIGKITGEIKKGKAEIEREVKKAEQEIKGTPSS